MKMVDFFGEMENILDMPAESIAESTKLAECETWDSLAMLAFAVMAHEKFGREFSGRSLRDIGTVGELYSL